MAEQSSHDSIVEALLKRARLHLVSNRTLEADLDIGRALASLQSATSTGSTITGHKYRRSRYGEEGVTPQCSAGSGRHLAEMSNHELAQALDDYRRWTILEPATQDMLDTAAQRFRCAGPPATGGDAVAAEAQALADKLDAIFDRIEVSCDWRLSSEERQEIAEAAKALRIHGVAQPSAATPSRNKLLSRLANSLRDWKERPQYDVDTAAEIILGDLERAGLRCGDVAQPSADSTRLELTIEQLLFDKIKAGRLVGFTVTVAHEIMGLIRNIGTGDVAQCAREPSGAFAVEYTVDSKGSIQLSDDAPFDGKPVLIKLAAGWCEAYWEDAQVGQNQDGPTYDGFCWVYMDGEGMADLDDAKLWAKLPDTSSISSTPPLCSCKASQRDGQHMAWCQAVSSPQSESGK